MPCGQSVIEFPGEPTVYTAEIPPDAGEGVVENNSRSVLVSPPGRKRRLLIVEGAPGFEHSFLTRAWAGDPSSSRSTSSRARAERGRSGHVFRPGGRRTRGGAHVRVRGAARSALHVRSLVVANLEGELLPRTQLAMVADFVGERAADCS